MNSKTFRRNRVPKPKSASSTFISLHFNKSDEDQLEISYKNDKKGTEEVISTSTFEVSQSNFYVAGVKKDVESQLKVVPKEGIEKNPTPSVSINNSAIKISKGYYNKLPADDILEESFKRKFPKTVDESLDSEMDGDLKLSPAIEVAEMTDSDNFNHYINIELQKAKCEKLDLKMEMPTSSSESEHCLKNSFFKAGLLIESKTNDQHKLHCNEVSVMSYIFSIFQTSINLVKYAQNSMKFHILIAVLACVCSPIPPWFSGFLIGAILSSSLVYWLYKPQKNKKHFHTFNFVSPAIIYTSNFQNESGILKGWMNELPSCMCYTPERYHVSCTRSVYVRLEGSYLRLSFPQKNIPKRAMFNEPRYEMQFIYQQHYDITDSTVQLLPQGLNSKRLWSKKYPICLRIPNHKGAILSQGSSAEGSFLAKTNKKDTCKTPRINENDEIVVYLFSRTDRDKSLWFSRFLKASKTKVERSHSPTLCSGGIEHEPFENKRNVDFTHLQNNSLEVQEDDEIDDSFVKLGLSKQQKFDMYMSTLLAPLYAVAVKKCEKDPTDKREAKSQTTLTWLNVAIGRLFFDFLIQDTWAQHVSTKIQKKLNRIKLPFFLSELAVRDINLGSAVPQIHHASDPCVNERGLWIDMDISYNGSFQMTLETKLNLQRFKADSEILLTTSGQNQNEEQQTKSFTCNSEDDSLESSSDDEALFPEANEDGSNKEGSLPVPSAESTSKKFMKLVDKLAQSSYFQHATKNKYVKKAMDDLSNTPFILTVEVQWLTGTLAVNIPPWPTDRLWYGFRTNPSLSITARPKLGQHVVTFTQITEWIEKKLILEFQKVLVMPNMDDFIIPIMQPMQDAS